MPHRRTGQEQPRPTTLRPRGGGGQTTGVNTVPAAANAAAFVAEALRHGEVWASRDEGGFPAPTGEAGERVMPFWSTRRRAERVIATVPAYRGFEPVALPAGVFRQRWLPGLERDGLKVDLNWAGARANGYDLTPTDVEARFAGASGIGDERA